MGTKLFYILKGNNGATYICNAKNWKSSSQSLKFYKAKSIKATTLKQGLHWYLFLKGRFFKAKLKSVIEIDQYLQKVSAINTTFNINENCSVLISPTNDKVIVHHHNDYFQKFAFGQSYYKVKNEAEVYKLFNEPNTFQVSVFFDEKDILNNFCSFKLKNKSSNLYKNTSEAFSLVSALVEFFNVSKQQNYSIYKYVQIIQDKLLEVDKSQFKSQIKVVDELKDKYGHLSLPLGLVHRDFKSWNILHSEKILIYDFEETIIDGPPLEDLFNYFIDPIILYKKPQEVIKYIYSKKNLRLYNRYLKELNIEIDFNFFLQIYLVNRILFWKNENKMIMMYKYVELSNHLTACHINQLN